jgi:hypothetical protein
LDGSFDFDQTHPIPSYLMAIAAGDQAVWPAAAELAPRIWRLYLTLPIYKAFVQTPEGFAYAEQVYAKAKGGYRPLTRMAVEKLFATTRSAGPQARPAAGQG